ncbi:MAG TPA: glutaminyl-peptide cyclotransferase [Aggregatilineales bacterium]|nr:glutaminyl-peptide cyclotransferase [Aggregatilineales bacterium]
MNEVLLIAGMTLVTFLPRWGVMALLGRVEMPAPLFNTLKYVPVAVLAAIIAPELLLRDGQVYISLQNATLMAGLVAGLVAWRTRNLLSTIGVGLLVFFLWQTIVAPPVAGARGNTETQSVGTPFMASVSQRPELQASGTAVPGAEATATAEVAQIELLRPVVLNTYPHDTNAFTQGLLLHEGVFYESTGRVGLSTLRKVEIESGEVLQSVDVPPPVFAEGLTLVDDRLIQITWQSNEAYVYDLETFEKLETFNYEGEGWGICYDGESLWMSDGSNILTERDPVTFEVLDTVEVLAWEQPVTMLNELECVDDVVFANIWQTDFIVRIDKATGTVTGLVDGSELLTVEQRQELEPGAVLNGIAWNPEDETFYLTGKLWPSVFEVQLESAGMLSPGR